MKRLERETPNPSKFNDLNIMYHFGPPGRETECVNYTLKWQD